MFLKETQLRTAKRIVQSPQNSPHKSNLTINESNACSFDELPVQKNRAMSHKKLSVVSINPKSSGAFTRIESQKNIEVNKNSRTLTKQNLQITWKKPNEQKSKFSLKAPNQNMNKNKQFYPPLTNITNNEIKQDNNRWMQQLQKMRNIFQKQINVQSNTINILSKKIGQLTRNIASKDQQLKKIKIMLNQNINSNKGQFLNRKLIDLEKIISLGNTQINQTQNNIIKKIQYVQQKILCSFFNKLQLLKSKTFYWIKQNQTLIDNLTSRQDLITNKVNILQQKIQSLHYSTLKIQGNYSFCKSTVGTNWEQLSDFLPTFNNASRMNNFSSMSFADDYFFYPKSMHYQNQLDFQQKFSRTTQQNNQNEECTNKNIQQTMRILELYEEGLPCVIDKDRKVVNMMNNKYLVNSEGNKFQYSKQEIDFLIKCQYLKVLKRYDM